MGISGEQLLDDVFLPKFEIGVLVELGLETLDLFVRLAELGAGNTALEPGDVLRNTVEVL